MKGSCIFFHDFRMVQLSLANELPPVRAKLACTASAHFFGNIICSFSCSKMRNVFCAGKNWNYICQNGTQFNGIFEASEIQETWIYSEFQLGSIFLPLFDLFIFVNLLNNWTRSHFGSSLALGIGICPPALTCLFVV